MIVFKSYFKIAKENSMSMIMPLIVLLVFLGMFAFSNRAEQNLALSNPTITMQGDIDTEFSKGLKTYLEKTMDVVVYEEDKVQDALFNEDIDAAVVVDNKEIEIKTSINLKEVYWIEYQVNQFINYYDSFIGIGYSEEKAIETINNTEISEVTLEQIETQDDDAANLVTNTMLFQTQAYPLSLAVFSMIITSLFMFQSKLIRNRQMISSMSNRTYNTQLALAALCVGHIIWIVTMVLSVTFSFNLLDWATYGDRVLNSYFFFISILALSFLFSKVAKTLSIQTVLSQGMSLGLSFISGIFVPQEFLGTIILTVSKFTPYYWYAFYNNAISYSVFNRFSMIGIQLGFTIIFVLIALIIDRNKQQKD